jgi:hypothetical protein
VKDLFGKDISIEEARAAMKKIGQPKGYAARPGSGPVGEFCRTCVHAYSRHFSKTYWKCDLVKATAGPGSDIRLKSPACQFWKAKQ